MLQPIRIPISILSANGVKNETAILTIVEYCSRLKPKVSISSTRNGYIGGDRRHAQGGDQ